MFGSASKSIESKTKDLVEKTYLGYYNNEAIRTISKTYRYRPIGGCSTWNKCYLPRKTNSTLMSLGVTPLIRDA